MITAQLLYPVFVQVALTFFLLVWMGRARLAALRDKEVKLPDIAVGQRAWPVRVQQISNTYQNQFELPLLFYALIALCGQHARLIDETMVVLAWTFVGTRLIHAYIYTTSNVIRWRFNVFALGMLILFAMWVLFAFRVITQG